MASASDGLRLRGLLGAPVSVRCLAAAGDLSQAEELRKRLKSIKHPKVIADSAAAAQLLQAVRTATPQVVVLDMDHAAIDPLYVAKNLRSFHSGIPLLITTRRADPVLASRLLRAGAQGFILDEDWPEEIGRALGLLASGACFVSESIMQDILQHLGEFQQQDSPADSVDRLTDRELIVFQFIGLDHPNRQIATELHLCPKTVATYRAKIKRKLRLTSDAALRTSAQRWVRQRNINHD